MKKVFLTLLSLTIVAATISANPIEGSSPGMAVMKSGSTFKLFYKGVKTGKVKVTIYDQASRPVFKETFNKVDNFMRPYNFSSLTEGSYTIEVSDENGIQIEKVKYESGRVEKLVNLKKLLSEKGKYLLTVSNKGEDILKIRILAEDRSVLYNETETISGDFAKVYNLDKVEGKVVFEVTDRQGNISTIGY